MSACITSAMRAGHKKDGAVAAAPVQDDADVLTPAPTDYPETGRAANAKVAGQPRRRRERGEPTIVFVGPLGRFSVSGQPALTLVTLSVVGKKGLTALEANSWAYRLGAYVHILRRDYRLPIETVREEHDGGWHARYVLRCAVTFPGPGQ